MQILQITDELLNKRIKLESKIDTEAISEGLQTLNISSVDIMGGVELSTKDNIAILKIGGMMVSKMDLMGLLTGGVVSHGQIVEVLKQISNSSYKAIVLDIDSGGGEVQGFEVAAKQLQSLNIPIYAFSKGVMASLAYNLASYANKIYTIPSASVGSIGAVLFYENYSKALENEGVESQIFRGGAYKAKPNNIEQLTINDINYLQSLVDDSYNQFKQSVANNRNLSLDNVNEWAEGKVFDGEQALKLGLIDGVVYHIDEVIGIINQDLEVLDRADGQSANNLVKNEVYNQDMTIDNNTVSQSDLDNLKQSLEAIKADNETIKQSNADLQKENEELKSKLIEAEKAPLLAKLPEAERAILANLDISSLQALVNAKQAPVAESKQEQSIMHIAGSVKNIAGDIAGNDLSQVSANARARAQASINKIGVQYDN